MGLVSAINEWLWQEDEEEADKDKLVQEARDKIKDAKEKARSGASPKEIAEAINKAWEATIKARR